jgi:hypothetical protein
VWGLEPGAEAEGESEDGEGCLRLEEGLRMAGVSPESTE